MELSIPSIVCEGCIETITQALMSLDDQAKLESNLENKTITIETSASLDAIRSAITAKGHILT